MELRENALLESDSFGAVANDIHIILDKSFKEMARDTGLDHKTIGYICNRRRKASFGEFKAILSLVRRDDAPIQSYLRCKYPAIFGALEMPVYPVQIALAQWLEASDQKTNSFGKLCASNQRGRYLLIRRAADGNVVCSLMLVRPPADSHSLAKFTTVRFVSKTQKKTTTGFIFELHGRVYAMGKFDSLEGLRFSSLHIQAHGERRDLFGIRLGIHRESRRTFAHALYAYQILKRSPRGTLHKIIGTWNPEENPELVAQISNFWHIYHLLELSNEPKEGIALWDNGIRADV
jgi:hypothetical protein